MIVLRLSGRGSVSGGQTKRRGGTGPAKALLGGQNRTGRFVFRQPREWRQSIAGDPAAQAYDGKELVQFLGSSRPWLLTARRSAAAVNLS